MSKPQWRPDLLSMTQAQAELTKKYLTLKHEQAYIQFENGRIARFQGGKLSIDLTNLTLQKTLVNAHMIHNHPAETALGTIGLSGYDMGFAATTNMKSIAVLDEGQGIRVTRPDIGWLNVTYFMLAYTPNNLKWEHFGEVELWTT